MKDANDVLQFAMKLLARRDYSTRRLREKLESRFGDVPQDIMETLKAKRFLNDRRYAENYVSRRPDRSPARLRDELAARGIDSALIDEVLTHTERPSLHDVVNAKMVDWNLRVPLQSSDATRLFRALARLGYEEDAIREEIETLL